jgi:hypothetical protein
MEDFKSVASAIPPPRHVGEDIMPIVNLTTMHLLLKSGSLSGWEGGPCPRFNREIDHLQKELSPRREHSQLRRGQAAPSQPERLSLLRVAT